MKITIFNGSPKAEKSNSHVIADAFAEGAESVGADVGNVFLINREINHCKGCFTCWSKTPGRCIYRDDMDELLQLYLESDIVCYATPVYLWNVTACMKNFLDRLIPTRIKSLTEEDGNFDMQTRRQKNPGVIIISNAGFPGENNFDTMKQVVKSAEPILEIYRNCGMLLRTSDPELRKRVDEYLGFVRSAGAAVASGRPVEDDIKLGLNMELLSVQRYVDYIGA